MARANKAFTALLNAVERNDLEIVEQILSTGLPSNEQGITDYYLLQKALEKQHREVAKLLIRKGCRTDCNEGDTGQTPIALAVSANDFEIVKMLIDRNVNFTVKTEYIFNSNEIRYNNNEFETVLHLAVKKGLVDMLRFLLNCKVDPNLTDSLQKTVLESVFVKRALHNTSTTIEIAKLLLDSGASINFVETNEGLLRDIVNLRDLDILTRFFNKMENVNFSDNNGNTVLHTYLSTVYSNDEKIVDLVKLLLSKGFKVDIANKNKDTPCHVTANSKNINILKVLLESQYGCNLKLTNSKGNTVLHSLLENSVAYKKNNEYYEIVKSLLTEELINIKNNNGWTPAYLVAMNEHWDLLKNVLNLHNINVNDCDKKGNTLLHLYISFILKDSSAKDEEIIQNVNRLLSKGAKVDAQNKDKDTPLHLSLRMHNKCINKLLVAHVNDPYVFDKDHKTYLHQVCENAMYEEDKIALTNILVRKKADVNARDKQLQSPLHLAIMKQQVKLIEILLKYGAVIMSDPIFNVSDRNGLTPFQLALKLKNEQIIQILISSIPNVNVTNSWDQTVLHHIVECKIIDEEDRNFYEFVIKMLLQKGSNVNITNTLQKRPIDLAVKNHSQNIDIIHILLDHGAIVKVNTLIKSLLLRRYDITLLLIYHVKNPNATDRRRLLLHNDEINFTNAVLSFCQLLDEIDLDKDGSTALHSLLSFRRKSGDCKEDEEFTEIVTYLASRGLYNIKNSNGETPLCLAIKYRLIKECWILLETGADICANALCARDNENNNLLHLLSQVQKIGSPGFIKNIVSHFRDQAPCALKAVNRDGLTPLLIAARFMNHDMVKYLLNSGAYVRDEEGDTELHFAVRMDDPNITRFLLNFGVDINLENKRGRTALHEGRKRGPRFLPFNKSLVWKTLSEHLLKLRAANLYVSATNNDLFDDINRNYNKLESYFMECQNEYLLMKSVKIESQAVLADILHMSDNKLSRYCKNRRLRKLAKENTLDVQFPHYCNLIKACCIKGSARSGLLQTAKESFSNATKIYWPDICFDKITCHLKNENLINLIAACKKEK